MEKKITKHKLQISGVLYIFHKDILLFSISQEVFGRKEGKIKGRVRYLIISHCENLVYLNGSFILPPILILRGILRHVFKIMAP